MPDDAAAGDTTEVFHIHSRPCRAPSLICWSALVSLPAKSSAQTATVLDEELQTRRKAESGGIHGVTGDAAERFAAMLRDEIARIWSQSFTTSSEQRRFADMLLAGELTGE